MQLGDPGVLLPSGESLMAVTAAPEAAHEGDNGGDMIGMDTNSGEEDKAMIRGDELGESKINFGGNRWPRQETLALLKIRSDMDAAFRDSSLKGPLWEEVSSKMAALGYHRTAKKCKEKFENVYKYHKRTKDSRSGKSEGKSYRFFDQLQALENHQFTVSNYHNPTTTTLTTTKPSDHNTTTVSYVTTVPTANPTVIISSSPPPANATTITSLAPINNNNPRNPSLQISVPSFSVPNMNTLFSTTSTSSSTASDEDLEERYRKKRKWKDYFRRLTRQVLAKQEEMQKRFLDAIDKRERERVAQQEAWRMQEMARINREHEILVQERSTAAAKDAAVVAFLQKLSGQQNPTPVGSFLHHQPPPPQPQVQPLISTPQPISQVQPQRPPVAAAVVAPNHNYEAQKLNNGDNAAAALTPMSSSRWPKAEVHALIRLRTSLDGKYQENGPKGPLWEEISAGMQRLGYNRSAKRCKEKWENINKYFKKMKESNKQRRDDSKTCPYFHELEALYKEKSKTQNLFGAALDGLKPNEMMEPLMVQPEQQWRPPPQYDQQQAMEDGMAGENNASELHQEKQREMDHDGEEEDDVMEEDNEGSVEDEDGGGGAGSYEIATNKLSSVDTVG